MSSFFTLDPGSIDATLKDRVLFRTATEFSMFITDAAHKNGDSITQTILNYCEDRDVDPSDIAKLVSKPLKELIALEMQESGLMKKDSTAIFE
jgi:hypothetical protein